MSSKPLEYATVGFVVAFCLFIILLIACAPPKISEFLKEGVNCKAAITMPDGRPGEVIEVPNVRIYECHEVQKQ